MASEPEKVAIRIARTGYDEYGILRKDVATVYQPKEEREKALGLAKALLSDNWRDYLYSHSKEALRRFLANKEFIPTKNLWGMMHRAKKLKDNNVPGIFKSEFESRSEFIWNSEPYYNFPSLDFMINVFSQRKGIDATAGIGTLGTDYERWCYAGAASLDSIINFASYATREQHRNRVLQEMEHRISHLVTFQSPETKEYVFSHNRKVLEEVSRIFRDSKIEVRPLRAYDAAKDDVLELAREPFWYCWFDDHSLQKIIDGYVLKVFNHVMQAKDSALTSIEKAIGSYSLMRTLFPEAHERMVGMINSYISGQLKHNQSWAEDGVAAIMKRIGWEGRIAQHACNEFVESELASPTEAGEEYVKRKSDEIIGKKVSISYAITGASRRKYSKAMERKCPGVLRDIERRVSEHLAPLIKKLPGYERMTSRDIAKHLGWYEAPVRIARKVC